MMSVCPAPAARRALGWLLVLAGLLEAATGNRDPESTLWVPGEDSYRVLNATVKHRGSCQPECSEEMRLIAAPGIPYRVSVAVMQADMQSHTERLELQLGSSLVTCNPMPASDYDCSVLACADVLWTADFSGLHVHARSYKTRDACKCEFLPDRMAHCYSALLSGLDSTYGMLVRMRLVPDVDIGWVVGTWSECSTWQCADQMAKSIRSVECVATSLSKLDPSALAPSLPAPGEHHCLGSKPPSSRQCSKTFACRTPPLCDSCFSLAHVENGRSLYWSLSQVHASTLQLSTDAPVSIKLVAGLADSQRISLSLCTGHQYVVRGGSGGAHGLSNASLQLSTDDGSADLRARATFDLRQVSALGFSLEELALSIVVVANRDMSALHLHSKRTASLQALAFEATRASDAFYHCSPSTVPEHLPREACRSTQPSFWCCQSQTPSAGGCHVVNATGQPVTCDQCAGSALVEQGRCEDINCSSIESHIECEEVATAFGLGLGQYGASHAALLTSHASLLTSFARPSFCAWQSPNADAPGVLWFNAMATTTQSSPQWQQLCRCGTGALQWTLSWSTGEWGHCSLNCGIQSRSRKVTCISTPEARNGDVLPPGAHVLEEPRTLCLEAGLSEPSRSEPCLVQACFGQLAHTRCAGEERGLLDQDFRMLGYALSNAIGGGHCVEPFGNSEEEALGFCQRGCLLLADCVGFTFYVVTGLSRKCCFLKRASRWEGNFRHATCHLLHGVRTLSGCQCQVGWLQGEPSVDAKAVSGKEQRICGPSRGGCCTTTDSGAISWCPTTSPSCGTHLQGQQRWDICDPQGMATATDGTCELQQHASRQGCQAAISVSRCNQIATALGLPDTTPTLKLTNDMPLGCIWHKSNSQLWLNLGNSSQAGTLSASQDFHELCACPAPGFRWHKGSWRQCSTSPTTTCGAQEQSRSVWCIRQGVHGTSGGGEIVSDSFCTSEKPTAVNACNGCTEDVLVVAAAFNVEANELQQDTYRADFLHLCVADLTRAMGIQESRLRVKLVNCCSGSQIHAKLFIRGNMPLSVEKSAADAVDDLLDIVQSTARQTFGWSARFHRFALHLSVSVIGVYVWHIDDTWGKCSVGCGGGTQQRGVQCALREYGLAPQFGVSEDHCDLSTKPADQQVCSTQTCRNCLDLQLGPEYMASKTGSLTHGASVWVTCAANYSTVDDVMLVSSQCSDGAWTPLDVSCGRDCPPFQLDVWRYEIVGSGSRHGSTRQVTCSDRSSMAVESPPSATAVCDDGTWTPPMMVCSGDCQEIELSNAYLVLSNSDSLTDGSGYAPHGASRQVTCADGFSSVAEVTGLTLICNDGTWLEHDRLPDCKANCPPYELPNGYEIQERGRRELAECDDTAPMATDAFGRRLASPFQTPSPSTGGKGQSAHGLLHGSPLHVQCADQDNSVPGAVEIVKCTDGQWSPLKLVCGKDCPPINRSHPEYRRYTFIGEEVVTDSGESLVARLPSSEEDASRRYSQGSIVSIGCREGRVSTAKDGQGELRCENGAWTEPNLECFDACAPFEAGPQYSTIILPEMRRLPADTRPSHGTRAFATCAEGYSYFGKLDHAGVRASADNAACIGCDGNESSEAMARVESIAFAAATCSDGKWSKLWLRCYKQCPFLKLHPQFHSSGGGGLKVNAARVVSCASRSSTSIQLRCSESGTWHIVKNMTAANGRAHVPGKQFSLRHTCDCASFVRRTMKDGVAVWTDASYVYEDVPLELIGATLFAGPAVVPVAGSFIVSADVDAMVFIIVRSIGFGNIPADTAWEPLDLDADAKSWIQLHNISVWYRSLQAGDSLEIPVGEWFAGGIAIKPTSRDAMVDAPYKIFETNSLCSPYTLIHTIAECKKAAKSLGIGQPGVKVMGIDTKDTDVSNAWVVPDSYHSGNPPGCYLRLDILGKQVQLSFNPDLSSTLASLSNKEWPICLAGDPMIHETPLDMAEPFPLDCSAPALGMWEKLTDDEEALILLLIFALCGSLVGLIYNLTLLWRSSRGLAVAAANHPGKNAETRAGRAGRQFVAAAVGHARKLRRAVHNIYAPSAGQGDAVACAKCRFGVATFLCFPCGHLCVCVSCAEEVSLQFLTGESDILCPSCSGVIECLMDAKPAGLFKGFSSPSASGRAWPYLQVPTLYGRSDSTSSQLSHPEDTLGAAGSASPQLQAADLRLDFGDCSR